MKLSSAKTRNYTKLQIITQNPPLLSIVSSPTKIALKKQKNSLVLGCCNQNVSQQDWEVILPLHPALGQGLESLLEILKVWTRF